LPSKYALVTLKSIARGGGFNNDGAYEFDGDGDYILLNESVYSYNWNDSYSVSVWVKSHNDTERQSILSRQTYDQIMFQSNKLDGY